MYTSNMKRNTILFICKLKFFFNLIKKKQMNDVGSKQTNEKQNSIKQILILLFLNVLVFGIGVPCIPQLVTKVSNDIGSSAKLYGQLLSFSYLLQFFSGPILGKLSDELGVRKPIILLQLFLNIIYFV